MTGGRLAHLALAGLLTLLLLGCGEGYETPLLAGTEPPTIRVRLGAPREKAVLAIDAQAWDAKGPGVSDSGRTAIRTTLSPGARGGIRFRGVELPATSLRIRVARTYVLDDVRYAGTLLVTRKEKALQLVGELDLETYVAGVIGNEVGPKAKAATYRAQAVTARTYAYERLLRRGAASRAFHVYDSPASQVYRGMSPRYGVPYDEMVRCTKDTRGVILMLDGRPMTAYYASTCGGHTTDARTSALDPGHAGRTLQGVPCRWCRSSKYFEWKDVLVADAAIIDGMKRIKRPIKAPIHSIEVSRRGAGGWAASVRVVHGPDRKARDIPGNEFRTALRLRSHNIQRIRRVRGGYAVDGRGWGHGVGMCQVGAIEMGRAGATETEILRYYYPGVAFRKAY